MIYFDNMHNHRAIKCPSLTITLLNMIQLSDTVSSILRSNRALWCYCVYYHFGELNMLAVVSSGGIK